MLTTFTDFLNMQYTWTVKEFGVKAFFEIALIVIGAFAIYRVYIAGTQSERLLKGIGMLLGALILSKILIALNFEIIGKLLETLVNIMLFGLVVIFQPELRRFLGYLGQPGIFSKNIFQMENIHSTSDVNEVEEITKAVRHLAKNHIGALMVVQKVQEKNTMFDVGTRINGNLSQELLLTIFHPNTALHDGAVIICNGKIESAGVLLPLTEDPKLSWRYGTRHRAAIGMSEISDYLCVVVSEETGNISIALGGQLISCNDLNDFKVRLRQYLGVDEDKTPQEKHLSFAKIILPSNNSKKEKDN